MFFITAYILDGSKISHFSIGFLMLSEWFVDELMNCFRNIFAGYANILLRTSNTQQQWASWHPNMVSKMSYQDSVKGWLSEAWQGSTQKLREATQKDVEDSLTVPNWPILGQLERQKEE